MIEFPLLHPEVGPEEKYGQTQTKKNCVCKVGEKFYLRADQPSGLEEEHLPCMLHLTEVQALWRDHPAARIEDFLNLLLIVLGPTL